MTVTALLGQAHEDSLVDIQQGIILRLNNALRPGSTTVMSIGLACFFKHMVYFSVLRESDQTQLISL